MKTDLITRQLHEAEYDRWDQLVANAPSGSIYSLPTYLDTLCSAGGGTFSIVGVLDGDELVGGIGLYFKPIRFGVLTSTRSLLAYQSPVVRAYTTGDPHERDARQRRILSALIAGLDTTPCEHMILHVRHPIQDVRPFQAARWQVRPHYTYIVPIADLPAAWGRVAPNLRRLIRRATDAGLVCTDDDDFDSLFRLHIQIHERKRGAPLYLPEAAFRAFVQRLQASSLPTT